jgi:DNA repair protein RecO (recombination protein O)
VQTELEPAYVLHRRSYRESSLLIELFTASHGRIGAIGRGFAKGGGLQPFQPMLVSWTSRRGELVTLTQAESHGGGHRIVGAASLCGFYLNELLLQALQRSDPHPSLFALYASTLGALSEAGADTEMALRRFEMGLLEEIGYAINLVCDVEDRPVDPVRAYCYLPGHGAVPEDVGERTREALAVSGTTLLTLAAGGSLDDRGRQEAKRLMRALLRAHLGDRPVFSRTWFEEY